MLQIGVFAVITCLLCITIRERAELSMLLAVAGGVAVISAVLPQLLELLGNINAMAQSAGIESEYIIIMFKVTGISAVTTVCAAICRDSGQSGLASKVEIAGRIMIIAAALPVIKHLFYVITSI